ncbi:MAG: BatA domain-containing protein [Planctomycetota bacterium]
MSFVNWIFLFGSVAVAGPVIAHLLARPRFRRLPFTMLRFLRTGQVESQSRRKLRDLLILLLRCAIIVLIAMLFARPLLHTSPDPEEDGSVFFLGLDNSMSMAYSDGEGSYFDKMVGEAVDYIRSAEADPGAPVFNICHLASGQWSRNLSKEQALAEVKGVKIEPAGASIGDFLSGLARANSVEGVPPSIRGQDARDTARTEHSHGRMSVTVLSDFTPHTLGQFVSAEEPAFANEIDFKLITTENPVNNCAIVDAHVVGLDDGKLVLNAAVVNYGDSEQERQLTANAGSNSSAPVEIELSSNQRRIYQVQLDVPEAGKERLFLPVELSLSGSDGLKEDDTFHLAVSVPGQKEVKVLLAGDSAGQLFLVKTAMDTLSRMSPYNTLKTRQAPISELARSDLTWADVVVCSTIDERMDTLAPDVQHFVSTGGRLVCFVTETVSPEAVRQLWRRDVLAAMPGKCLRERTYPQPKPCDDRAFGVDNVAARSLVNYKIDKILLKGYLECTPHAESRCLWQLQNDTGFMYVKKYGRGTTILVNTSVDDSLGTLTKSNASVAFCRYLLGESSQVSEHCFERSERVLLPVPEGQTSSGGPKQALVETCDGRKRRAAITDTSILVPDSGGIGWVKTLGKPTTYAGINLPQGETDMAQPARTELARIMSRVFPENSDADASEAGAFDNTGRRPLWRVLAWLIILLLLVEPAVANRLKR